MSETDKKIFSVGSYKTLLINAQLMPRGPLTFYTITQA